MNRCAECGLYLLDPHPTVADLHDLYPQNYVPHQPPGAIWLQRLMHHRHYALRVDAVERAFRRQSIASGRLLDIGCGAGGFLHVLGKRIGWQVVGCDISFQALTLAHQDGVPLLASEGATLALADHSCDVVTLWEVIEHVPDPRAALREAARVLKPGGLLLLSTPNAASWGARFWGNLWFSWDIPRHIYVFALPQLQQLLHETGFRLVGKDAFPLERFVAVSSAQRWLATRWPHYDIAALRRLIWLLGIACWPLLRIIDHTPVASGLALVAVRIRDS